MNRTHAFVVFATVPALLACSALKPSAPGPGRSESAAIGINVKISPPLPLPPFPVAEGVYYAKLEPGKPLTEQAKIVESNYMWQGRAYLLNADPGEYVAVATYHYPKGISFGAGPVKVGIRPRHVTLFPSGMVEASKVTVAPQQLGYMGTFVVDLPNFGGLGGADPVQKHFGGLIDALVSYQGGQNTAENSDALTAAFIEDARSDLGDAGWGPAIARGRMVLEGKTLPPIQVIQAEPPPIQVAVAKPAPELVAAPTKGIPPADLNAKTMAVFPPKYIDIRNPQHIDNWNKGIVNRVATIGQADGFRISHSVFSSPGAHSLAGNSDIDSSAWASGGFFSGPEPNLAFLGQKARELNVDMVLMWKLVGGGGGTLTPVLFDAATRKVYTKTSSFGYPNWERPTDTLIRKLFADYKSQH